MRRRTLAILSPLVLFTISPAGAHAVLNDASPPLNGVVQRTPTSVTLRFSEDLEPAFSMIEVLDRSGSRIDQGNTHVSATDASVMEVGLEPLPAGTYKVIWRALSADMHKSKGDFTFRVVR